MMNDGLNVFCDECRCFLELVENFVEAKTWLFDRKHETWYCEESGKPDECMLAVFDFPNN